MQLRHQMQQQRSLSPGGGAGVSGYVTQNAVAQQMARAGMRVPGGGQSAPFQGAAGGEPHRAKLADQTTGGKSPGELWDLVASVGVSVLLWTCM